MYRSHTSRFKVLVISLIWLFVGSLSIWQGQAYSFSWTNIGLIFPNLSIALEPGSFPIHFNNQGNNYLGSITITKKQKLFSPVEISFWSSQDPILCKSQLQGYYFSSARWLRVYPLSHTDSERLGNHIQIAQSNQWLYTECGDSLDTYYDIMWAIEYKANGVDMGSLVFGVETDRNQTDYLSYKQNTITRQNNVINGSFFDSYGIGSLNNVAWGWGVIWGVSNLLSYFSNVYIQGRANIGKSVDELERNVLMQNLAGTKTILTASDEANIAQTLNTVKANATKACRNQPLLVFTTPTSPWSHSEASNKLTFCADTWDSNFVWYIDSSILNHITNRDIVLKRGSVFLDKSVFNQLRADRYLSLYIENWHLIFDQDITEAHLRPIDKNSQLSSDASATTKWAYLFWNFFVNGLILGGKAPSSITQLFDPTWFTKKWFHYTVLTPSGIPYKTLIQGRVASLNTLWDVSSKREQQLQKHLWSQLYNTLINFENRYYPNNQWNASMGDLFSWVCEKDAEGSNEASHGAPAFGTWVIQSQSTVQAIEASACAPWQNFWLTIIQRNIPTRLLQ